MESGPRPRAEASEARARRAGRAAELNDVDRLRDRNGAAPRAAATRGGARSQPLAQARSLSASMCVAGHGALTHLEGVDLRPPEPLVAPLRPVAPASPAAAWIGSVKA